MTGRLFGMFLVLFSTSFEAGGQLSLKSFASKSGAYKWLAIGLVCFAIEAVLWTYVLKILDVSIAFPMSSLSFVAIAIMSKFILNEEVSLKRWAGVCLILCGTAIVGLSH